MPRETWEMDEGRGMLHPAEWYGGGWQRDETPAALRAAAAANYGPFAPPLDEAAEAAIEIGAADGAEPGMPDGVPLLTASDAVAPLPGWTALPGSRALHYTSLTHRPPVPPPRLTS
jgi:hypothetical protein